MGIKQSKIKGEYYLPPTTSPKHSQSTIKLTEEFYDNSVDVDNLDPRSPHICRTPMNETDVQSEEEVFSTPNQTPKLDGFFKKKFFKTKKINELFDPRSPSTNVNRTPIVITDADIEKTLDLSDTFSDLFINNDSIFPKSENTKDTTEADDESDSIDESTSPDTDSELSQNKSNPQTPETTNEQLLQSTDECHSDPRSPTIGVDRTPIILSDSTSDSMKNSNLDEIIPKSCQVAGHKPVKPKHKALERIKNAPRVKTRSSARLAAAAAAANNKLTIYKDRGVQVFSTPKKTNENSLNLNTGNLTPIEKRTPLGCVANKTHLRSVENTRKSKKTKLPQITSFDDYNMKRFGSDVNDENNTSMNNFITRVN